MTLNEYQDLAARTGGTQLFVSALGLCGESGEAADILKKHLGHNHPLDDTKLIKELGDVLWYVSDICTQLGYQLEHVAGLNIEKLRKRYPEGFSSERSINRPIE